MKTDFVMIEWSFQEVNGRMLAQLLTVLMMGDVTSSK